jgi:polyisoprenoid-binding protein YceI
MKRTLFPTIAASAILLASCGAPREEANTQPAADAAGVENTYALDLASSSIKWTGNMTGAKVYNHFGTLNLSEGRLIVKGGQVSGGSFTVDMTSMVPTDEGYSPDGSEQGTKAHLIGHLSSEDFFDVANHPTATFVITRVEGDKAIGNLTIRGNTHEETVTDIVVNEANGTVTATGKLVFDRQKYNVAWAHPVKDFLLANDIELEITLSGSAAAI